MHHVVSPWRSAICAKLGQRRVRRAPAGPAPELLGEFTSYLREARGLEKGTLRWYLYVAELFLADPGPGHAELDVAGLSGADVNAFVLAQRERRGTGSLNNLVTALRALLDFFYMRG